MPYFFAFLGGFVCAVVSTPIVKRIAVATNILDIPDSQRKRHAVATPLLGGLALFFSFTVMTLYLLSMGYLTDGRLSTQQILGLLIGGGIIMLGGILDDRLRLSPKVQIIFPLLAVLAVLFSGVTITAVTSPLGGVLMFGSFAGTIIAGIWLLGMSYTTKFLDGLDGLTAGITAIGALVIFSVSLFWDVVQSGTSLLALVLVGSCLGFLLYNWHPAKIFLGEGGSLFCGFALGVLAIISGSKIATTLLVMGVPILDVLWVLVQRMRTRQPITSGDRRHLHFRLVDIGLKETTAVTLLYGLTVLFGVTSLFLRTKGKIAALLIMAVVVIALLVYILKKVKEQQV